MKNKVPLHRLVVLCSIHASASCETITNDYLIGNQSSWSHNEI